MPGINHIIWAFALLVSVMFISFMVSEPDELGTLEVKCPDGFSVKMTGLGSSTQVKSPRALCLPPQAE